MRAGAPSVGVVTHGVLKLVVKDEDEDTGVA